MVLAKADTSHGPGLVSLLTAPIAVSVPVHDVRRKALTLADNVTKPGVSKWDGVAVSEQLVFAFCTVKLMGALQLLPSFVSTIAPDGSPS